MDDVVSLFCTCFFFFEMVSNAVVTQCDVFVQRSECQRGENFKTSAGERQSCWTEASVVRYTTKIMNYVSSCSSPVASALLCCAM